MCFLSRLVAGSVPLKWDNLAAAMGLDQMDIRVHVTETTNPSKYTLTNAIKPPHSLYLYIYILS
jgi:hypothetical protein